MDTTGLTFQRKRMLKKEGMTLEGVCERPDSRSFLWTVVGMIRSSRGHLVCDGLLSPKQTSILRKGRFKSVTHQSGSITQGTADPRGLPLPSQGFGYRQSEVLESNTGPNSPKKSNPSRPGRGQRNPPLLCEKHCYIGS